VSTMADNQLNKEIELAVKPFQEEMDRQL